MGKGGGGAVGAGRERRKGVEGRGDCMAKREGKGKGRRGKVQEGEGGKGDGKFGGDGVGERCGGGPEEVSFSPSHPVVKL